MVEGRLNLQAGHLAARILGRNSASKLLFVFGVIFLLLIIVVLFLAVEMPRCNVLKMPCEIDEKGKGLCSLVAADGSCWARMTPVMKCFEGAISVKSGLCKGTYETRLCAESEKEVQDQMLAISKAMTDLNVQKDGLCNVTTVRENQRCRLPLARQEENEAIHTDCCRAPIPTCASDLDCTNCGLQSPACAPPLRCMATVKLPQGNGTIERSVDCEPEEDACLSFSYFGCDGVVGDGSAGSEASCDNGREDEPFLRPEGVKPFDLTCCDDKFAPDPVAARKARNGTAAYKFEQEVLGGVCKCRSKCQRASQFYGCPCTQNKYGCHRKMCVQSSLYSKYGGPKAYLEEQLGASYVAHCFTDNCNMRDPRGFY